MKPMVKGAVAVAVLVLAAAVALVPRWQEDSGGQDEPAADPAEIASARDAADLPQCPTGDAGAEAVPDLTDTTAVCVADGSTVDLGSALAGKTTLVNVWATWCQPCRDELPVLQEYARSEGAVDVLTVQVNSDMLGGLRMFAELDVQLPVVHDGVEPRGEVAEALNLPPTMPASYVISPDGTVNLVEDPRVFHDPEQVRDAVARYGSSGGDE